jgi:hypothetical protein
MGRAYSTNLEKRNTCRVLVGEPERKKKKEEKEVGGWTILKWILEK